MMKFQPISHSWVAVHPQARSVVQFIGGAFFGTFGTRLFYQHILNYFYDLQYTIIILPFKFTFNHYAEAGFLIGEQYDILPELINIAKFEGYDYSAYLDEKNFYWLGHSIGCKYITLLEGFSALPSDRQDRKEFIEHLLAKFRDRQNIDRVVIEVEDLIESLKSKVIVARKSIAKNVDRQISLGHIRDNRSSDSSEIGWLFIRDQSSLFLAPENSGTDSAIQVKWVAKLIDEWGIGVSPSPMETNELITQSKLFNKLGLISFQSDTTANPAVNILRNILGDRLKDRFLVTNGGHLRPLGFQFSLWVFNPFDLLYAWLRYLTRIDRTAPQTKQLAPVIQTPQNRNLELEDPAINLFESY